MEKSAIECLKIIKHPKRPNVIDYINHVFENFIEMHGDRLHGDDPAVIGGIATINDKPVTIIGQVRSRNTQENLKYNFSMAHPEGFRKALRIAKQAEKFRRPIIFFVDTVGASPDIESEKNGQHSAISNNLMEFMFLKVPTISVLIGNGGSGGALAFCIANKVCALENSILSVISPKAGANIIFKDSSKEQEAAKILKMTSDVLFDLGIVDKIIREPDSGAHNCQDFVYKNLKEYIFNTLTSYKNVLSQKLVEERYKKYRKF